MKNIWGANRDKNAETVAGIEAILDRYHPDAIVIEDWSEPGSRRSARIRRLYRTLTHVAGSRMIDIYKFTKRDIQKSFKSVDSSSNYAIAQAVARQLPEFFHRLPKKRRIWESERLVMALFAAGGLGITFYSEAGRGNPPADAPLEKLL